MLYSLEITREAKLDIQEAWLWYEERNNGLGDDFLLMLEALLDGLKRNPFLYEEKYDGLSVGLLKRFPYKVVYTIQGDVVGIIGVIHTSRNPTIWKDRV